ncbi:MAG: 16S rRNA (cytosine(1402)-N(4))-methyltransferase RsmH [Candidatus Omnitrophica bacterium]|nr:16S rRNA (cytosine(1402)-N(4))-methyltransferase RsmH [Candidatus Omnitrophota bacterium]
MDSENGDTKHVPVLLAEAIEGLDLAPGDIVVDGTAGAGGHAEEILKKISPSGKLIAIDRDNEAILRVEKKLGRFGNALICVNDNFRNIGSILKTLSISAVNGVLLDLGMSSYQLDDAQRGFSFSKEGPLDMRYNVEQELSASDIINRADKYDLEKILREYGEERHAKLLAQKIVEERKKIKISTTAQLSKLIIDSIGRKYYNQRLNPAARTFQALRIFTNDELGSLEYGLENIINSLASGGRICVIDFHSLEDKIVKNIFHKMKTSGILQCINKKPIVPAYEEVRSNPRARSAKLRIGEKI